MARLGKFFYINGTDNLSNAHFLRVRADGGITESLGCIDTAGTLLESASYFMRPSGYKEDTVYSLIPNNSNGSLNFVRASDAWRTEIGGLVQRTPYNLAVYSEQFENANWNKYQSTINTNATVDPNGNLTADKIVSSATTSEHYVLQNINANGGVVYSTSVYLKAGEYTWAKVASNISGSAVGAFFNLSTGVVGTIDSGVTASIQSAGNGWYRCTITSTAGTSGLKYFVIWPTNSGSAIVYTGDGTSGIFAYGFQVVEGADQLPYFPTTDRLNVPRLSYMYGSCPALLLEPQRTNLALQSESFDSATWGKTNGSITANSTNAPNGTTTADTYIPNTVNSYHPLVQTINVTSGAQYTFSIYVKSAGYDYLLINTSVGSASGNVGPLFNLSTGTLIGSLGGNNYGATITSVANGFYRIVFSYVTNSTSTAIDLNPLPTSTIATYSGNGTSGLFVWGAQLELGAYATTIIPTTTASATRIADSFSRNNIYTNGLITSAGGTWFVELRGNLVYEGNYVQAQTLGLGKDLVGSTANNFWLQSTGGTRVRVWKQVAGNVSVIYDTTTSTTKIAIKWNGSTADVFANGTKVVSATSFTATVLEDLRTFTVTQPYFIQQMALFNYPLSDSDCQLLTT